MVSDFPLPPPKQKIMRGAELNKANFLKTMDKVYFSILHLRNITELEEKPVSTPPPPHPKPTQNIPEANLDRDPPPPSPQASTDERRPRVAMLFRKLALPGVKLLAKPRLLTTPALNSTTANPRTSSSRPPPSSTLTPGGRSTATRRTSTSSPVVSQSVGLSAAAPTVPGVIGSKLLRASISTMTTCQRTKKIKIKKWTRKKDGTFGWTMVSATPPRMKGSFAPLPPTAQGGQAGGGVGLLKNGENLKFWLKKESSGSLQLDGTRRLEPERDGMNGNPP